MARTPLFDVIAEQIRDGGPIGLDRYMALCLGHPLHGYYRTRDPLGAKGDFTTAPEISQMFGELIGLWAASVWAAMGVPGPLRLVELGPGRGTLAADALRAIRSALPALAGELHLIETSPVLRIAQHQALAAQAPSWHEDIATLPQGPAILIANEFFDALPVRQFERTPQGWRERLVGLSPDGTALTLGLSPDPDRTIERDAPTGVVLTLPSVALDTVRRVTRRIAAQGGALLTIDYGHARPGFGDSLQAVAGHRFADPFAAPGEADLTAHVDFSALAAAASAEGGRVHGPVPQRDLLLALGLRQRADRLAARATRQQATDIEAAFARLTDPGRRGMGTLFKAMGVGHPSLDALPGLQDRDLAT